MKKTMKKLLGSLTIASMALGVGLVIAEPKGDMKAKALTETYTYVTGDGTWTGATGVERTYTSANFTMRHNKNSGSAIIDTAAQMRLYAGHSLELYPTDPGSKTFTTIIATVSETKYASPMANAALVAGTSESSATAQAGVTITTSGLLVTFDFSTVPGMSYVKLTFAAQSRATKFEFVYENAVDNRITALSATPTTKSYWTTDTLAANDYTVTYTKNGTGETGNGQSFDYTAKIGTGTGDAFTGTDIVWGTTKPKTTDTTLQFRANYPNASDVYLTFDITLTVTAPVLNNIVISGTMTKKNYLSTAAWDPSGLTVTANYSNSASENVTALVEWSYNPPAPNSTAITSVVVTATFEGKTADSTQTNIVITQKVDTVMISEVYGGGGNTGAPYKKDFVEIFNATNASIDLTGYSVQYTSYNGTSWNNKALLSGSIPAKSYYLIELNGGSNGVDLPTPDATGAISMSATDGKVALVNGTDDITGAGDANVIDFVGFGKANEKEGSGAAPATSNTKSISRNVDAVTGEPIDTDDNANDFVSSTTVTPKNTAISFSDYFLDETLDTAYCTAANWTPLKNLYDALADNQKAYFATIADAVARHNYLCGANANLTPFDASLLTVGKPLIFTNEQTLTTTLLLIFTGLSLIAYYYVFRKKARA